ncbi:MAG: gluconate 2-dehydrogenase subunit 3 family protein [Acidimicrobiales bacterium]
MNRRQFLTAAAAAGVVTALPTDLHRFARTAMVGSVGTAPPVIGNGPDVPNVPFYFLTSTEVATCAALCARIVPSTDPETGAPAAGATEAHAVVFIDRFLAAFDLPSEVAENPAVYLHGRYSNRNAYPDYTDGEPSSLFPADDFLSTDGQAHFVALDDFQELSWRWLVEGEQAALAQAPASLTELSGFKTWVAQVNTGLIPGPSAEGLQSLYRAGLSAFESYAQGTFGVPFAKATPAEQDLLLEAAGNAVLSQVPLPSPPGAPADAKALFPYVVLHTFEGCYGLPEYRWLDANQLWAQIAFDGDTQPLGNSIYDANLFGPGQGPNAGFGFPLAEASGPVPHGQPVRFVPEGGYREYRPVSTVGGSGPPVPELTEADIASVVEGLTNLGVFRQTGAVS